MHKLPSDKFVDCDRGAENVSLNLIKNFTFPLKFNFYLQINGKNVASLRHLFASFYKALFSDHHFYYDGIEMKFKSSIDVMIKNFPDASISNLLK